MGSNKAFFNLLKHTEEKMGINLGPPPRPSGKPKPMPKKSSKSGKLRKLKCESCGAPVDRSTLKCAHCDTEYTL